MLIKEGINKLCKKCLSIQPSFGLSGESVVTASPIRESSLTSIIYGDTLSSNGGFGGEEARETRASSSSEEHQHQPEDSLMQLVYNYPEKTLWFLNTTLNTCIVLFSVIGISTTAYTLRSWNHNYSKSPFLTAWLLVHGLLQIIQATFRICYKFVLGRNPQKPGGRIISILQSVKRLTLSGVWRMGRVFSLLYYFWFSAGFYWILSVRPSTDEEYDYQRAGGAFLNKLNRSDLIESSPYVLAHASAHFLNNGPFGFVNNLFKVDLSSNIWSCYLAVMLICTLRIVGMLLFFYLVFPSVVSNEYSENKSKACTLTKLESIPVKTYEEWKRLKETKKHNCGKGCAAIQENCIICLNDFSSEDLTRCLACNHVFHEECIDLWLLRNAVCPLCQTSLG